MKLLYVDKAGLSTLTRAQMLADQHKLDVEPVTTYEAFTEKYAKGVYHAVIIDFTVEAGQKALELIDRIDPKQRVITISATESYSEPHGCTYCAGHHNRRRLKEPFPLSDLAGLIRDFDFVGCVYYREENS